METFLNKYITDRLKPCPKCGRADTVLYIEVACHKFIECSNCRHYEGVCYKGEPDDVISFWNNLDRNYYEK